MINYHVSFYLLTPVYFHAYHTGSNREISVTFRPDHPSDYFADVARLELYGKHEAHSIVLKGVCKSKIMYILGGDDIKPTVESLAVVPQPEESSEGNWLITIYNM